MKVTQSFVDAWANLSEDTTNKCGEVSERGARALLAKYAKKAEQLKRVASGADSVEQVGAAREAAFGKILANPGPGFKRIAMAFQGPLKDRNDYIAIGRKLLLTDMLP